MPRSRSRLRLRCRRHCPRRPRCGMSVAIPVIASCSVPLAPSRPIAGIASERLRREVRHYVLTRSAYGPAWDREANARRLEITRAVTARLMAHQTAKAWTWVVLLDERDPFAAERLALYRASAPA